MTKPSTKDAPSVSAPPTPVPAVTEGTLAIAAAATTPPPTTITAVPSGTAANGAVESAKEKPSTATDAPISDLKKKKFLSPPIGTRITYCYFCPKSSLGFDGPKHILDDHFPQCYECKLCDKMVAVDVETLQKHLKSEHKFEPMFNRPRMLESVRFPEDGRHIKCLKCSVIFMGQDLSLALEHLSKKHGVVETNTDKIDSHLILSCRHCSTRIENPEQFETHIKACFVPAKSAGPSTVAAGPAAAVSSTI